MNPRLAHILNTKTASISEEYYGLLTKYANTNKADKLLQNQIDDFSKGLLDFTTSQMQEALDVYSKLYQEVLEIILNERANGKAPRETEQRQISHYKVITNSLKFAIDRKKKAAIQNPTHFLELTTVRHPVFIATTPQHKSLEPFREQDGAIQVYRAGLNEVTYRNEHGIILGNYDAKVLAGLFKLWAQRGKNQHITFEFKDLAKAMFTQPSGGEYRLMHESLRNLYASSMMVTRHYGTDSFNYSTDDWIPFFSHMQWISRSGREVKKGTHRAASITLSDFFQQSLLSGNVIYINMILLNRLSGACAKTVYLMLMGALKERQQSFHIDRLLQHIAVNHPVNLPGNRSRSVQQLIKALKQLQDLDVIESYEIRKIGNRREWIEIYPSDWVLKLQT